MEDQRKPTKKGKFEKMRENLVKANKGTFSSDESENEEPQEHAKRPRVSRFRVLLQ